MAPTDNDPNVDRPARVTHTPIQVGPRRKISEIISEIPPKYLSCVRDNELLDECCRAVESSFIFSEQSNPDIAVQDLLTIECNDCGKKQYRTFVNRGTLAAPTS